MLCAGLCISVSACTNMFFQPMRVHVSSPEQYGITYEDVYFEGRAEIKLHGWWFPAAHKTDDEIKATILFLHGNGENISTHAGLVYWLTEHRYNVFIFDYRGYGKSQGEISLSGALDDINSARHYVDGRKAKNERLFVIGHSMGASMGIYNLATHPKKVDGVVLVSPFSKYPEVAREMMSKSWLTWVFQPLAAITVSSEYNPVDYVAALPSVPKLFIYSEGDQIIAPYHIKTLYRHASENKSLVEIKGNHNSVFAFKENQKTLLKYLDKWSKLSR